MQIHLVDATYELFRAHYAPRPPVLGRDGVVPVGRVRARATSCCTCSARRARPTSAARRTGSSSRSATTCSPATSRRPGCRPELLAQFPIAEAAIEALGVVLWPMVEFEADDAIAAAAARFGADPAVERILICTPDKDMAQCVVDERIVLWDRRRGITYDDAGVRAKWGVAPASIPDCLALVGDSSDGYPGLPGWGAKSAAAVLARYGSTRGRSRSRAASGTSGRRRRRSAGRSRSREQQDEAILYRDLARLRTPPTASRSRSRRRRARVARARRGRVGGVLRRVGARPAARAAASLARGVRARVAVPRRRGSRCLRGIGAPAAGRARGAAGAATIRTRVTGRRRTTGRRRIAVTVAPARSAIRPAAATSQADIPPAG